MTNHRNRPLAATERASSGGKQAVHVLLVVFCHEVTDLGYDPVCDIVLANETLQVGRKCRWRLTIVLAETDANRVRMGVVLQQYFIGHLVSEEVGREFRPRIAEHLANRLCAVLREKIFGDSPELINSP